MSKQLNAKRALIGKIEAIYNTDSIPTGAANAVLAKNVDITPLEVAYGSREGVAVPFFGRFASKTANKWIGLSFDVELPGGNAAGVAPSVSPILRACALAEVIVATTSVTYNPISGLFESATIYVNKDGMQHRVTGWRGSAQLVFQNEEIPVVRFRGVGMYNVPTDTVLPTLTLTTIGAPLPMNRTNTQPISLHGYAVGLWSATVDLGNVVNYVPFPGTNGTDQVLITDRRPVGSVEIEHPTIAAKDFYSIVESGAVGAFSLTHGTVAGNKVAVSAAQTRLTNPRHGDQRGVKTLLLDLELAPSNAGNDELSIAFT